MTLLVISDSHGNQDNIRAALDRQIKRPDAIVFLGDGLRDVEYLEEGDIPIYCVRGNCDTMGFGFSDVPDERLLTLGSKRILITHGHTYHVKSMLSPLVLRANELGADIVLFGHTHRPFEMHIGTENEYGIALSKPLILMNPGSIGSYPFSFGNIEIINISGQVLSSHGTLR